jgi:hypothetical protein
MAADIPERRFSIFAMPLVSGGADTVRRMREEALGARRSEYEESRRRLGITDERAWIQSTPTGEMVLVYLEAEDPQRALQGMAESQEPFDVWFRQYIQEAHAVDIATEQAPPPESVFEWRAAGG